MGRLVEVLRAMPNSMGLRLRLSSFLLALLLLLLFVALSVEVGGVVVRQGRHTN